MGGGGGGGGAPSVLLLTVACASSFSFLLGYDIGIMSGAKRLIKADFELSDGQLELLVGILNLVSGPGGLLSGRLADSLGRRASAAIACAVTLVGALLMASASSFAALLTGRVITGVGVGCCFHVAPLYIAEVAPKQVRGKLVSFFDLWINIGILAGYLVGWALTPAAASASSSSSELPEDGSSSSSASPSSTGAAWRMMLAIGAIPPLINLIALVWLPETPRFLVAVGRERDAADVLARVCGKDEASATLALLRTERRDNKPLSLCAGLRRVLLPAKGAPRAMIVAGIGCAFWQQATGVEAAVYYTPETLEAAGVVGEADLLLATVGIGCVKVGFIILAACLVEKVGRVKLMLVSNAGLALASLLLGLSFSLGRIVSLALVGQALFMAAFSVGVGPCAMMVASELFPLQVRGFALGVATLVNRVTSGLVALTFLSLSRALTPAGAYYLFASLALGAAAFVWRCVPETKGKSLEEIEQQMAQRYSATARLLKLDSAAVNHAAHAAEEDGQEGDEEGAAAAHRVVVSSAGAGAGVPRPVDEHAVEMGGGGGSGGAAPSSSASCSSRSTCRSV